MNQWNEKESDNLESLLQWRLSFSDIACVLKIDDIFK